jgi:general secretion pathway protein F
MVFVVPKIIEVFATSGQTLPLMTLVLISVSHFFKVFGLYALLLLVGAIWAFKRALKQPVFRQKVDQWILKIPFVAFLVRSVNLARYIHTFSILFGAGVSVLETMRVSASVITNRVMRDKLTKAAVEVREGTAIHSALKQTQLFGAMATHLIASGEKSGELANMMEKAASHLDTEVQRLVDTLLTLLEPVIILLMGAVVLFIVLATLLPIFSMQQLV